MKIIKIPLLNNIKLNRLVDKNIKKLPVLTNQQFQFQYIKQINYSKKAFLIAYSTPRISAKPRKRPIAE